VPAVVAAPLSAPVNVVADTLPNVPLPVADIIPPVIILPAFKLPVAVIKPAVPILPILALPDTLKLANVPVLVILGCTEVVNTPVKKLAETKLPPATLLALKLPVNVTVVNPFALVNVNAEEPLRIPPSLNCIVLTEPPAFALLPPDRLDVAIPELAVYTPKLVPSVALGVSSAAVRYNSTLPVLGKSFATLIKKLH